MVPLCWSCVVLTVSGYNGQKMIETELLDRRERKTGLFLFKSNYILAPTKPDYMMHILSVGQW